MVKRTGQQQQGMCIKSKGEAHKNVTVLELNIHKREVAEVGKGGTL